MSARDRSDCSFVRRRSTESEPWEANLAYKRIRSITVVIWNYGDWTDKGYDARAGLGPI